ncbi:MqnA/MqnD/SBP family protein [Desulfosarcina sp.]|uniref:MqnA/MqnD/SBP family protein n=1 Tax=Desulfosarcina sp. TaxID=2027861 RepID=UPI0039708951
MSAPVAMIPYTNMAPYRQLAAPRGCHFVSLVPRASIGALLTGRVAAAAVPVGGLPQLAGMVETAGRFGIAAKGPSMSVLFFSHGPFEAMQAPKTLRLTSESASSVRLLFLLLGRTIGFDRLPNLATQGREPDGELLIGDRALIKGAAAGTGQPFDHVTDLSQVWFDWHGLPFVFARWVVRKDAPAPVKTAILEWLDEFKDQESVLVARAVPEAADRLKLPPDLVVRYFQAIRRCLDDSDLRGQERFFQEFEQVGRTPLFQNAG